jgi:hypothetical protein
MPQTLIAILSMVVTTLFAFNQHRNVLSTRLGMIREEMAVRSTSVAVDVLEEIGSMAFDEATLDKSVLHASDLTHISMYDQYGGDVINTDPYSSDLGVRPTLESGGANDLDDFDGAILDRIRIREDRQIRFRAEARVRYVDEVDRTSEVGFQTKLKKVTIKVYTTAIAHPDTIYISQIYSCGSKCEW